MKCIVDKTLFELINLFDSKLLILGEKLYDYFIVESFIPQVNISQTYNERIIGFFTPENNFSPAYENFMKLFITKSKNFFYCDIDKNSKPTLKKIDEIILR